jgi:hypothetical protein
MLGSSKIYQKKYSNCNQIKRKRQYHQDFKAIIHKIHSVSFFKAIVKLSIFNQILLGVQYIGHKCELRGQPRFLAANDADM